MKRKEWTKKKRCWEHILFNSCFHFQVHACAQNLSLDKISSTLCLPCLIWMWKRRKSVEILELLYKRVLNKASKCNHVSNTILSHAEVCHTTLLLFFFSFFNICICTHAEIKSSGIQVNTTFIEMYKSI